MTGEPRQLAAIMYTDVVGYTGMMQKDEPATINRLEEFKSVLENIVHGFDGTILQYYGDGSLVIFNSAYKATLCGMRIQQLAEDTSIPLRIGIHLGEIIKKEGAVYGDGLNIAARLESLGVKGSILISGSVHEQIHNQPFIKTKYLGKFRIKNVFSPLSIYSISNDGFPVPEKRKVNRNLRLKSRQSAILRRKHGIILIMASTFIFLMVISLRYYFSQKQFIHDKSIVVLPFVNLSEDSAQNNFCQGITEDIQSQLSKIRDLYVIPGFSLKDKAAGDIMADTENEPKAAMILRGSVRKAGNKIRVFAELIDVKTNLQLWSDTYDRDTRNILGTQKEIAVKIVAALQSEFSQQNLNNAVNQIDHSFKNLVRDTDFQKGFNLYKTENQSLLNLTVLF